MRKKIPLIGGIINLIESLKGDIGIIENTDVATHSISAGSYVIWHNELYKASSAIAVDDALSSSNLTAVSGGAANDLIPKDSVATGEIQLSSLTSTSSNMYYKDFTYGKTFASAPKLIMSTVNNTWPSSGDIGGNYFATNVTTTGFRLYCKYNMANYYIHWIAICL